MRLSKQQVKKYISYRTRYLYGTAGVYEPDAEPPVCSDSGNNTQERNQPVSFLRHINRNSDEVGTFLNVDSLPVNDPDNPESGTITNIKHGDNLIYSSFAALNFAAEYSITLQSEPLELCISIIESFQRLGSYQQGLNEQTSSSGPHGYMLRADSPDEKDKEENICTWKINPDDSRLLEPSYDQYCGLLSCLRMIQEIISETEEVPEHNILRGKLNTAIIERVQTSVMYLAGSFWTILWRNADNQPRVAKRGAFCIHAAYPFSKIAALTLSSSVKDYFFGKFPLAPIENFDNTEDLQKIGLAVRTNSSSIISRSVEDFVLNNLVDHFVNDVIGDLLGEISKFIDGEEKVKDAVRSAINNITDVLRVVEELSKQIIDQIVEWVGFVVGVHSIPLSIFLHRYYSKYMLQGFRDDLFMELGDILDFMGIEKPRNPGFDFPISITFEVADSPPWWPDIWVWEGWTKEFIDERISLELPLDILWELPIPIGIIDPLSLIITGVGENLEKKPDLQMLLFINNVAAQTFDENRIDPVKVSYENDNCFMMASTYRMFSSKFLGQHNHDNRRKFVSVMANLDSAPSDFPNNQSESSPWHQNFRWMRGADNSPDGRKIYGGMDFMLPLILSASQVKDIHFNRAMLLEALAPIIIEDENMGPFKLPFQGPYTGEKSIFSPKAGGTQSDTIIYIGVVFDRGRGVGELKINYNDLGGNKQTESFSPNDPSKMIAVPLNDRAVTAELTSDLKGYFLIQSSA